MAPSMNAGRAPFPTYLPHFYSTNLYDILSKVFIHLSISIIEFHINFLPVKHEKYASSKDI